MSKKSRLLIHLKRGHSVTVKDSMRLFGLNSLSQRIGELRREGHNIHSGLIWVDRHTRVSKYWISRAERER